MNILFWSIIVIVAPSLLVIHVWLQHRRTMRLQQIHKQQVYARLKRLETSRTNTSTEHLLP